MSNKKDKWKEFAEKQQQSEAETADQVSDVESPVDTEEAGLEFPSHSKLEDQLTAAEQKADDYKNQMLRMQAELENVRRRAERDVANAHKYGSEKLLSDMLPVVDSLIRGMEIPEAKDPHVKAMRDGMQLTLDLFEKALAKHGLDVIDPAVGEAFDPQQHEAMSMQQDPEAESNTILQVIQKGYSLNGRVIRAAMVIVAA